MKTKLLLFASLLVLFFLQTTEAFTASGKPIHYSKQNKKVPKSQLVRLHLKLISLQHQLKKLKHQCQTGWGRCLGNRFCVNQQSNTKFCGKSCKKCLSYQTCEQGKCIGKIFSGGKLLITSQMKKLNTWAGYDENTRWRLCFSSASPKHKPTKVFHTNCNHRGPSFTILRIHPFGKSKLEQYKNRIVGGFAPVSWQTTKSFFGSKNTFLFLFKSPNHKGIRLNFKTGNEYLYSNKTTYGPTFGNGATFVTGIKTIGRKMVCRPGTRFDCPTGSHYKQGVPNDDYPCIKNFCGAYRPKIVRLEVYVRW